MRLICEVFTYVYSVYIIKQRVRIHLKKDYTYFFVILSQHQ